MKPLQPMQKRRNDAQQYEELDKSVPFISHHRQNCLTIDQSDKCAREEG